MKDRSMRTRATALILAIALPAAACGQELPGLSASDRQVGQEANTEIVQQYGGAMTGPLAAYVERVGKRIAVQSNPRTRPDDYRVTLLNSTVPNAFATPGGYVYVTRGLLAIMNDEAELASVMGHEVGHVAAQHSRSRSTRPLCLVVDAGGAEPRDAVARGAALGRHARQFLLNPPADAGPGAQDAGTGAQDRRSARHAPPQS
jgi:hypothetical protein